MAITGVSNYNSVYENTYASSRKEAAKKEETKETSSAQKSAETTKKSSNEEYLKNLQKQVPYMKLEVGNGLSMARDNKVNTLAVNPKLLEKMQNDPEKAKEYMQRLKDIENAQKFVDGYMKAKGSTTKFSHWYVDENGNYSHIAYYEHDNTFYKKLSEKSRENIKKHIEKTKEKAAEKKEALEEMLKEKETAKTEEETGKTSEETSAYKKAKQLIDEKIGASKDDTIYLNDTDIRTIMEAVQEDGAGKHTVKEQAQVGVNLDFRI